MHNPFPSMNPHLEQPGLWPQVHNRYSILVSRSGDRPNAELYEFDLPDPIPCFPVPLQASDLEPVINLQQVVNELYTHARLDLAIDYSRSLIPDLSEAEIA